MASVNAVIVWLPSRAGSQFPDEFVPGLTACNSGAGGPAYMLWQFRRPCRRRSAVRCCDRHGTAFGEPGRVDVVLQLLRIVRPLPRAIRRPYPLAATVRRRPVVAGQYDLLPFIEVEPFQRFQHATGKPSFYGPHDLASSEWRGRRTSL